MYLPGQRNRLWKKKGEQVNDLLIEKKFIPDNSAQSHDFQALFKKIPETYWTIAENVLSFARENYSIQGNAGLVLSLSDHMAGSVERYKQGVALTNPMLIDIKRLYPSDYTG